MSLSFPFALRKGNLVISCLYVFSFDSTYNLLFYMSIVMDDFELGGSNYCKFYFGVNYANNLLIHFFFFNYFHKWTPQSICVCAHICAIFINGMKEFYGHIRFRQMEWFTILGVECLQLLIEILRLWNLYIVLKLLWDVIETYYKFWF